MFPPGLVLPLGPPVAKKVLGSGILAALAGFPLVAVAIPAIPGCGWVECGSVPWAALGLGLAFAVGIVAWIQRTATAVLAAGAAAAWWLATREGHPPTWTTVAVVLVVVGGTFMALSPWRPGGVPQRPTGVSSAASLATPPAPEGSPWVALRTTVAAIVMVAIGSGLLWWLAERRLPSFFGSEGVWYGLASAAAGIGLGLGWRAVSLNRSRRRFFASPQPVQSVQVAQHATGVYVTVIGEEETIVAQFPTTARFPSRLNMYDGPRHFWRGANMGSVRQRPALLYGDPAMPQWGAVVVDSTLLAPFAPMERLSDRDIRGLTSERDAEDDDDDDNADDEPDLHRDLPEEPGALAAADRSPSAAGLRTHQLARSWAYALVPLSVAAVAAAAMFLGIIGCLSQAHPSMAFLIALALAGLGAEIVWRVLIRPRFAWNDSGIALVTGKKVCYLAWHDVHGIELDEGVKLRGAEESHVIPTSAVSRWLAPGERSPQQLTAALRDSRRRAMGIPAAYRPSPPTLDYPARSPMLWVLWLASAIPLALALLAVANGTR